MVQKGAILAEVRKWGGVATRAEQDEIDANADLFAASWDGLQAAQLAIQAIESGGDTSEALEALRYFVAKATGHT